METKKKRLKKLDAREREFEQLKDKHGLLYTTVMAAAIVGGLLCLYGAVAFGLKTFEELNLLQTPLPAPMWLLVVGGGLVTLQYLFIQFHSGIQRTMELKREIRELEAEIDNS